MVASKKRTSKNCWLDNGNTDKSPTSLSQKRRNFQFFRPCYAFFCKLRNIVPNTAVKERAGKSMLDVNGDRLKIDEWVPIIEALKHDRNLHFISFRSRYPSTKALEEANSEAKARAITRSPVMLSKFILQLLLESLAQCFTESTSITCIELDGLPLKKFMPILCKGISANTSLQTISFCNSHIGDEGCKLLCMLVKSKPSILHLDLSNCDLGVKSAVAIAETLKHQYLQHFAESWKQSLRYCESKVETMPGLRRITLNNNLRIGDEGVKILTEVLKEDIWIRALDLQNCNVGNEGAKSILEVLDINNTLCIVDVRDNSCIDDQLMNNLMLKLSLNAANKNAHEFNWIVPKSQLSSTSNSVSRSYSGQKTRSSSSVQSASFVKLKTIDHSQNQKKTITPSPSSNFLQKKEEIKNEKINSDVQGNSQNNEKNYLLMKVETCDALCEALEKFKKFIEHLKQINEETHQNDCQGDSDSTVLCCENRSMFLGTNEGDDENEISTQNNASIINQAFQQELLIPPEEENEINISLKSASNIPQNFVKEHYSIDFEDRNQTSINPVNNEYQSVTHITSLSSLMTQSEPNSASGITTNIFSEKCTSSQESKIQELYENIIKAGTAIDMSKIVGWLTINGKVV